jgi:hypothetical protein
MITKNNYKDILEEIKQFFKDDHFLFYCYYSVIDTTIIDESLSASAAISFIKKEDGSIQKTLVINPDFQKNLSFYDWRFIITHEMLHLLLEHPKRYFVNKAIYQTVLNFGDIFNIAADISVNHLSTDMFDINRNEMTNWKDYCWVETIFHTIPGLESIKSGETTEYYLDLLMKNSNTIEIPSIQNHDGWSSSGQEGAEEGDASTRSDNLSEFDINQMFDDITEKFVSEVARELRKPIPYVRQLLQEIRQDSDMGDGNGNGGIFGYGTSSFRSTLKRATERLLGLDKVPKMREAWTELFKTVKKRAGFDEELEESWSRTDRRFISIMNQSDILLPTEYEIESKGKMKLAIFVNTGKYCSRYIDSFKKLIASIPKDTISYKLYAFSSKVHEANDINDLHFTGGGAYISCVEKFLKNNGTHYPDAVLVVTDPTFYDTVSPQYPERWFFCLTNGGYGGYGRGRANTIFNGATKCLIDDIMKNRCVMTKT